MSTSPILKNKKTMAVEVSQDAGTAQRKRAKPQVAVAPAQPTATRTPKTAAKPLPVVDQPPVDSPVAAPASKAKVPLKQNTGKAPRKLAKPPATTAPESMPAKHIPEATAEPLPVTAKLSAARPAPKNKAMPAPAPEQVPRKQAKRPSKAAPARNAAKRVAEPSSVDPQPIIAAASAPKVKATKKASLARPQKAQDPRTDPQTPRGTKAPKHSAPQAKAAAKKRAKVPTASHAQEPSAAADASSEPMVTLTPAPIPEPELWEKDSPVMRRISQLRHRNAQLNVQLQRMKKPL